MYKNLFSGCFILLILSSCTVTRKDELPIINLTTATRGNISKDEIFEDLKFIQLETRPECLLNKYDEIHVTDKYIIAIHHKKDVAYLFDRETGNFIRQIGQRGNGPGEYAQTIYRSFNEEKQILYFDRHKNWIGIHIETGEIDYVEKPHGLDVKFSSVIDATTCPVINFFNLDSATCIGYVNNISGSEPMLLAIFDHQGNILKTYPNHQSYINYQPNSSPVSSGHFYRYEKSVYFKEPGEYNNDTIYRVSADSIVPYMVFYEGDKHLPYSSMENSEIDRQSYYSILLIGENNRYIFFEYWYKRIPYSGYYDKARAETYVCDGCSSGKNGFTLDLDKKLCFYPHYMNIRGEVFGLLAAEEIVEFMKNNQTINSDFRHLSTVKEDDNPIVVIGIPPK